MTNNLIFAILYLALKNKFIFFIASKALTKGAEFMRNQDAKQPKQAEFDLEGFLKSQELELVETFVFNGKKIYKVKDKDGKSLVLKTSGIEKHQKELFGIAKSMENELYFSVPEVVGDGEGWLLMEDVGIDKKYLLDMYDNNPKEAIEIARKISDDYQKVVREFLKRKAHYNILENGRKWLFSRLLLWSSPLVEAQKISFDEVKSIGDEFEEVINKKGEDFFGWFHGNIMGDHIIISDKGRPYLLDLHIAPRAGRGYHDFLRSLDFMFLKSEKFEELFPVIVEEIESLSERYEYEVKLVFAFRNIGILGWDVLKNGDSKGFDPKKQELMLKFIKREY